MGSKLMSTEHSGDVGKTHLENLRSRRDLKTHSYPCNMGKAEAKAREMAHLGVTYMISVRSIHRPPQTGEQNVVDVNQGELCSSQKQQITYIQSNMHGY